MIVGVATFISTPIGILAGIYLAEYGKAAGSRSATRFINDILLSAPSIVIGLFIYTVYVAQGAAFLGLGRIVRARADRHSRGRAHDREHAAAGAQQPARSGRGARRADVEGDPDGHAEGSARRRDHRHPAGGRAHVRRNRAATVHRAQQPVLEHQHGRADGQPAGRHLPVRAVARTRTGSTGLGRRAADHADRAHHQHPRPLGVPADVRFAEGIPNEHGNFAGRASRGGASRCRRRRPR